jgi:hypothetical protein
VVVVVVVGLDVGSCCVRTLGASSELLGW